MELNTKQYKLKVLISFSIASLIQNIAIAQIAGSPTNQPITYQHQGLQNNEIYLDASTRAIQEIQKVNEKKALSNESELDRLHQEMENRRKSMIRQAQRWMRRSAVCPPCVLRAFYLFEKAKKLGKDNRLYIESKNNFDEFYKGQQYMKQDLKTTEPMGRYLEVSEGREDGIADDRNKELVQFSVDDKKTINKTMKALSLKFKKKFEYDFKKNQILVNKKITSPEEIFNAKTMASTLPASEQSSFISRYQQMESKMDKIDDKELIGKSANNYLKNFEMPAMNSGSIKQDMNLLVDNIKDDINADIQAELDKKAKEEADAKNLLKNRTPSNVAGFTKDYNGDAIGLATDSLFGMVKKRYKTEESHGAFEVPQ